jgi:hypothetical protein
MSGGKILLNGENDSEKYASPFSSHHFREISPYYPGLVAFTFYHRF